MQPDTNSTINPDGCMCGWGCVGGGGSLTSDEALLLGSRDQHQYYLFVLFCVFFFKLSEGPSLSTLSRLSILVMAPKAGVAFIFFFR